MYIVDPIRFNSIECKVHRYEDLLLRINVLGKQQDWEWKS